MCVCVYNSLFLFHMYYIFGLKKKNHILYMMQNNLCIYVYAMWCKITLISNNNKKNTIKLFLRLLFFYMTLQQQQMFQTVVLSHDLVAFHV